MMTAIRYPAGTGTYSKGRSQFPELAPHFAVSGRGSRMLCSDGREYIDWTAALGAVSLGHADPDVLRAVRLTAESGNIFGLPHQMELDYAEEVAAILPWPDAAVKYGKHGSDVTTAAIRAAQFLNGRTFVVSQGYHGWQGWSCPNPNGIVDEQMRVIQWDGQKLLEDEFGRSVSAVIVEPDAIPDLPRLRSWCDKAGAFLIFDEVLTGFRMPGFTFAAHCGITPDFLCLAKAVSNGIPFSVVAGPAANMKPFGGDIGYSMTYGGELTGIAAARATLRKCQQEPVIARLWDVGERIRKAWADAAAEFGVDAPLTNIAPRNVIQYKSLAQRTLITQELWRRGIAAVFGFCAMYAHSDSDIDQTCEAIREALRIAGSAGDEPERLIEGPVVATPYRQMVLAGTST